MEEEDRCEQNFIPSDGIARRAAETMRDYRKQLQEVQQRSVGVKEMSMQESMRGESQVRGAWSALVPHERFGTLRSVPDALDTGMGEQAV